MSWGKRPFGPYDDPMGRPASGHVERLPSGSFRVEVQAGTDPLTGRRLRFRQTVKTEKQAQIVLGRLLEQASAGQLPDSGVTIAELLTRYMEVAELDVSTRETYEGYIRRTILPALGSMELRKLRGPVLDMFYARLRRCGNLVCTGRPFTEHRYLPALVVVPGDSRRAWQQAARGCGTKLTWCWTLPPSPPSRPRGRSPAHCQAGPARAADRHPHLTYRKDPSAAEADVPARCLIIRRSSGCIAGHAGQCGGDSESAEAAPADP